MIYHFLENSAARYPDKTAVIHEAEQATYSQINTMADNLAGYLHANKIKQGDRIALIMENSIDYIISYYAILKAGAVVAPLNPGLKPDGLQYLIDDLEPAAIIANFKSERLLKALCLNKQTLKLLIIKNPKQKWDELTFPTAAFKESISGQAVTASPAALKPDDLASIIYTSGSTGKPKGVMLSHNNIVSNTHSICQSLELGPDDIQMVVLPFFYVMGKSLLNTHFAVSGTVVINNRFIYPADVVKQMAEENVTGFSGVPSTYAYLLHRSPLAKYRDKLYALRYCSQAGGHMAAQLKKDLRATLPEHTRIVIMYGATEASARLSCLVPEQFEHRPDSIGRAIPGVNLRIMDDAGRFVKDGGPGELVARGPNIMLGYWKDPDSTSRATGPGGWYHTGDMAYQDADGYFYVTGRKDNLLKVSGHKVNPLEIEESLMQSRQLLEVVVGGVPDPLSGYRLIAFCVPIETGVTAEDLQRYCRQTLPKHQVPAEFVLMKNLPKSATGKIDVQACMAGYSQQAAAASGAGSRRN
ncbi:MAG: class I adenylate-forming enzyme family protein [Desulfosalsimonadaceae bacterium]